MSDERLEEIRKRCEAASQEEIDGSGYLRREDRVFLYEAVRDIPWLLAEVERLRAALRLCRNAMDDAMGDTDLDGDDSLMMRAMQAIAGVM